MNQSVGNWKGAVSRFGFDSDIHKVGKTHNHTTKQTHVAQLTQTRFSLCEPYLPLPSVASSPGKSEVSVRYTQCSWNWCSCSVMLKNSLSRAHAAGKWPLDIQMEDRLSLTTELSCHPADACRPAHSYIQSCFCSQQAVK